MLEDIHFLRETVVDINAAVIGISSKRWTAIPEAGATLHKAADIMRSHRFDVLPFESMSGTREYYQADRWNDYSAISRKTITHRDVLPFTTPLRDLIQRFALEARYFYFLTSERRIVGLVSVANLNCRHVKTYLFSLLCDLEIRLGTLISQHCSEYELLQMTFGTSQNGSCISNTKFDGIKNQYNADKVRGVDVPFAEYLYLSDLINVISKKKLFDILGYSSRKKFEEAFGPLNELRNTVAHPSRSLIINQDSSKKLWERIDQVEEILFVLPEVW